MGVNGVQHAALGSAEHHDDEHLSPNLPDYGQLMKKSLIHQLGNENVPGIKS